MLLVLLLVLGGRPPPAGTQAGGRWRPAA
jgi:hypothetical protein